MPMDKKCFHLFIYIYLLDFFNLTGRSFPNLNPKYKYIARQVHTMVLKAALMFGSNIITKSWHAQSNVWDTPKMANSKLTDPLPMNVG